MGYKIKSVQLKISHSKFWLWAFGGYLLGYTFFEGASLDRRGTHRVACNLSGNLQARDRMVRSAI
jgi:hypothetical protein